MECDQKTGSNKEIRYLKGYCYYDKKRSHDANLYE